MSVVISVVVLVVAGSVVGSVVSSLVAPPVGALVGSLVGPAVVGALGSVDGSVRASVSWFDVVDVVDVVAGPIVASPALSKLQAPTRRMRRLGGRRGQIGIALSSPVLFADSSVPVK